MNNANSHVVMVTLFDSLLKIFPVVTSFAVVVDNSFMMTSMDTLTREKKRVLVSEIIINHNNNYYNNIELLLRSMSMALLVIHSF